MLKILGSICIVTACAMLGIYFSQIQQIRKRELNCIKKALLLLKSQIEYSGEALPEALHNIALRSEEPIKTIFDKIANELMIKKGDSISQVWTRHFNMYESNMKLSTQDIENINAFGRTLGYLDKAQQVNNIKISVDYIDETTEIITRKCERDGKMYQSLGLLGGILLAVLLL
jgi:stage III sporulation protein AB